MVSHDQRMISISDNYDSIFGKPTTSNNVILMQVTWQSLKNKKEKTLHEAMMEGYEEEKRMLENEEN